MDIFSILTLIGGLALFLYGMNLMGNGLKSLAGGKLESILAKLTSTKTKGFILGLVVTAIIQSSSATICMVVGFVNSGIMKLAQTIGIILGANIGTTVTAWLLSLSGINGENVFLRLLKPESFSPILALIGIIMLLASDRSKHKNIASILLGFAILMFGMKTMSSINSDTFSALLIKFSNPFMGVLIGIIVTAIIQSSSASVGILQALALSPTSAISYSVAIPIIIGENIGAAITPILSALSGNTSAKRVAILGLYIKIFSAVVIAAIFYILNSIFKFSFMDKNVTVVTIAIIHTLFNILATIAVYPFDKKLIKLTKSTLKKKPGEADEESNVFSTLDERFISTPSFAIEKCRSLICDMSEITKASILDSIKILSEYNKTLYKKIQDSESEVDRYEDKTGAYLVKITKNALTTKDNLEVSKLLHIVGDIERISDHSVNISNVAQEINDKQIVFSPDALADINTITQAVSEIITVTIDSFVTENYELAKKVEPLDAVIDTLKFKIKDNHIKRLCEGGCTVEMGFILSDILTTYERISGHCSNIAISLLESEIDTLETHDYLKHIKSDEDNEYAIEYQSYKNKYSLKNNN